MDGGWREPGRPDVTGLLAAWSSGEPGADDRLVAAVYDELRRLARSHLRGERRDHTLQATALVHEAYLRLVDQRRVSWRDRAHFFGVAARMMRRILVDHARARRYAKRGGGRRPLALDELTVAAALPDAALIALDEALDRLTEIDPEKAKMVELRFFGGFSGEETADILAVSPATVQRHWRLARAWLFRALCNDEENDGTPRLASR